MARTDDDTLPRTLKRARKAAGFTNAKDFLAAVKDAEGSAPSYSTYAQWESGEVAPRDETIAAVRRFHEARGTWAPLSEASLQERAVVAAERSAAAAERQAAAAEAQLQLMRLFVPSERQDEAVALLAGLGQSWAAEQLARTPPQSRAAGPAQLPVR